LTIKDKILFKSLIEKYFFIEEGRQNYQYDL